MTGATPSPDGPLVRAQRQAINGKLAQITAQARAEHWGDRARPLAIYVPFYGWSREAGAMRGYFEATAPDGTTGYFMRRSDDCLQAAVATLLQVPTPAVPDLDIDRQLFKGRDPEEVLVSNTQRMVSWAARRGLRIALHHRLPVSEKRWIGIVPADEDFTGRFNSHCLVMSRDQILWDPNSIRPDRFAYKPDQIGFGITFREE